MIKKILKKICDRLKKFLRWRIEWHFHHGFSRYLNQALEARNTGNKNMHHGVAAYYFLSFLIGLNSALSFFPAFSSSSPYRITRAAFRSHKGFCVTVSSFKRLMFRLENFRILTQNQLSPSSLNDTWELAWFNWVENILRKNIDSISWKISFVERSRFVWLWHMLVEVK